MKTNYKRLRIYNLTNKEKKSMKTSYKSKHEIPV